jgi:hypothetical protein
MPLTQQPSFEAVKTLDVRPSTRAGNSKTTSYIPRRVLYTEPRMAGRQQRAAGRQQRMQACCFVLCWDLTHVEHKALVFNMLNTGALC